MVLAHHEQVELVNRMAAGAFKDHRVEEIGPAFENPHPPPRIAVTAGESGSNARLALPRSRRGDQQGRAMRRCAHKSMPGCARIPARKACFTSRIALTVSAASIKVSCAARPVITTCCIGGRAWMAGMISSTER